MDMRELEKAQTEYKNIVNELQMLKGEEVQLQKEKDRLLLCVKELGFSNIDEFIASYKNKSNELFELMEKIKKDLNNA